MPGPQPAPEPIDCTLTVSLQGTDIVITGGDDNTGNVSVPHCTGNKITLARAADETWTFSTIWMTVQCPVDTSFELASKFKIKVQDDKITINDDDLNDMDQDQAYEYSLELAGNGQTYRVDPMIVNKAGGGA